MMKLLVITVGLLTLGFYPALAQQAISQKAPVAGSSIIAKRLDIVSIQANGYRATRLIGSKVHNEKAENIGVVRDLIVAGDGKVTIAIVAVGSFLGIGGKNIAVPVELFQVVGTRKEILLNGATKKELRALPEFQYAKS